MKKQKQQKTAPELEETPASEVEQLVADLDEAERLELEHQLRALEDQAKTLIASRGGRYCPRHQRPIPPASDSGILPRCPDCA